MTAVGVRLNEAPGAPTQREVFVGTPPGQPHGAWLRVALGDIHLSGDIQTPGLVRHPKRACSRPSIMPGRAREIADSTMNGNRSLAGDPRYWKDAL